MDMNMVLNFCNGWRVSVVRNDRSYGLELATLKYNEETEDYEFTQFPSVTGEDGVNGYLTADNLVDLLAIVRNA